MTDPSPLPPKPSRTPIEAILTGVKELLPAVALSAALLVLTMVAMPAGNEKAVLALISGLLGFLTGRATAHKGPGQ